MSRLYQIVEQLTRDTPGGMHPALLLQDFSKSSGWHPSYSHSSERAGAKTHLLVEHGLQISAVISFLKRDMTYASLSTDDRYSLLSLSYNNMVDWHIAVEPDQVHYLYNRQDSLTPVFSGSISLSDTDNLHATKFDEITGRRPSRNLRPLDDALIETIQYWKKQLSGELQRVDINSQLSDLFNGIIFSRAAEDHLKVSDWQTASTKSLRHLVAADPSLTICDLLRTSLTDLTHQSPHLGGLINFDNLGIFNNLDTYTIQCLIADFYTNKYAKPYDYDFSVISNHALSRIYEKYVSLLRLSDDPQGSLFPIPASVDSARVPGAIYTPQFIARFFARYIQETISPARFKRLTLLDPACGSGIFLRTTLELQCDPTRSRLSTSEIQASFASAQGFDIDSNAVSATKLSLALLSLVLTGEIPNDLGITKTDTLAADLDEKWNSFDAVIMNPPYIKYDEQPKELRDLCHSALEGLSVSKPDTYVAFLSRALKLLKDGGICCAVLPRPFLVAKGLQNLRKYLSSNFTVHCIIDLSAIPVFQDVGVYVVLIVLEKGRASRGQKTTLVKCNDFPGNALQDVIDGKVVKNAHYVIAEVAHEWLSSAAWTWNHADVRTTTGGVGGRLIRLEEVADIRQGFVSGSDDVFIMSNSTIPVGCEELFVPFLRDREIEAYRVRGKEQKSFFMPELDGQKLSEEILRKSYPAMMAYLEGHRAQLEERSPVKRGAIKWWEPVRMRGRRKLLVPKIVTPHLIFLPKFAIDTLGKYAVSRSPYITFRSENSDLDLLYYLVAVLNSDVAGNWLTSNCHTYSRGYAMVEVGQLKELPIPDPAAVDYESMRAIVDGVRAIVAKRTVDSALEEMKEVEAVVKGLWI